MQLSAEFPGGNLSILHALAGAILDCGGWILSRDDAGSDEAGIVFEFPRDICVEMYSALVELGLELNSSSHRLLTDLCRCTPGLFGIPSRSIMALDAASLDAATSYICSLEIFKVQLQVSFAGKDVQRQFHASHTAAA